MTRIPTEATAFLATHARAYLYVLDSAGKVRGWPMIARFADGAALVARLERVWPGLAAATEFREVCFCLCLCLCLCFC